MPSNPPEWSQVTSLLNVLAIVNALVLALMVTMYSEVECEDPPRDTPSPLPPHSVNPTTAPVVGHLPFADTASAASM